MSFAFERDLDRGWLAGVCAGLAVKTGVSRCLLRLAFVSLGIITGFFPFLILYIVLAVLVPVKGQHNMNGDSRNYNSHDQTFNGQFKRGSVSSMPETENLELKIERLAARIGRLESYVTSDAYHVDREFRKIRN